MCGACWVAKQVSAKQGKQSHKTTFLCMKNAYFLYFFYVFIRLNEFFLTSNKKIKKTFMRLIPNQQKLPTAKVRDTYHMYTTVPLYVQFNTKK